MARHIATRPSALPLAAIVALTFLAGPGQAQGDEAAPEAEAEDAQAEDDDGGFTLTRSAHANSTLGQIGVRRVLSARPLGHLRTSVSFWTGGTYYADFIGDEADDSTFLIRGGGVGAIGLFDILEISGATDGGFIQSRIRDEAGELANASASGAAFTAGLKLNPLGALALFDLPSPVHVSLSGFARIPLELGGSFPDVFNTALSGRLNLSVDLTDSFGLPFRFHANGGYRAQLAHYVVDQAADTARYNSYFLRGRQQSLLAVASEHWFYDQAFGGAALELPFPFVTPFVEAFWQTGINVPARYAANNGPAYDYLLNPITTVTPGVRLHPVAGFNFTVFADIGATGTGGYLNPVQAELVNGQPLQPLVFAGVSAGGSLDAWPFHDSDTASSASRPQTARVCARDEADVPVAGAEVLIDDVAYSTRADGCTTIYLVGDDAASVRVSKADMVASEASVTAGAALTQVVLASAAATKRPPTVPPMPAGTDETAPQSTSGSDGEPVEDGTKSGDTSDGTDKPDAASGGETSDGKTGSTDTTAPNGKGTDKPGGDATASGAGAEGTTGSAAGAGAAVAALGTVKGQVRAGKKAASRALVTFTAIGSGEVKTAKARRGKFTIKLAPGKYAVTAFVARHLRSGTVLDVVSDESVDVKIVLKKAPRRRLAKAQKSVIKVTTPIAFAPDTAELLPAANFVIADVTDVFLSRKGAPVLLLEASGPAGREKLARSRAQAVARVLKERGVPPARVKISFKVAPQVAAPTLTLRLVTAE